MSEQPISSREAYRYPADTALFNSGERVDLHAGSGLPSREEGLENARRTIAAAFEGGERPQSPTSPQVIIAEVGMHLGDFRRWAQELNEGTTPDDIAFREVRDDFEHRATQANVRPVEARPPQQMAQTDMMGYEPINAGR